jgi:hypothetical protein
MSVTVDYQSDWPSHHDALRECDGVRPVLIDGEVVVRM